MAEGVLWMVNVEQGRISVNMAKAIFQTVNIEQYGILHTLQSNIHSINRHNMVINCPF